MNKTIKVFLLLCSQVLTVIAAYYFGIKLWLIIFKTIRGEFMWGLAVEVTFYLFVLFATVHAVSIVFIKNVALKSSISVLLLILLMSFHFKAFHYLPIRTSGLYLIMVAGFVSGYLTNKILNRYSRT